MWRFGQYHYLNSHCTCIRKSITLISIGAKLSDKCYSWFAATMLLPIQVETNMASNHFPEYLAYKKVHWIVARSLHIYFRPFISQILDFIYWTVDDFIYFFFAFPPIRQKPRFWTMERQHVKYQASFCLSLQKEKRRRNAWSQVKMPPKIARPNETRLCGRCKKGKNAKKVKREGSACYKHQCFCILPTIFW